MGYTAQVVRTKTVSIEVKTSGKPADGYRVSGVTLNRDSVVVYGDTNMLNSLDKIVIPASNINVDGLTENKVYKFGLSDYIDKSLTILDNARIEVTVRIESTGNKTITLNTSDIKVSGLETDNVMLCIPDVVYVDKSAVIVMADASNAAIAVSEPSTSIENVLSSKL